MSRPPGKAPPKFRRYSPEVRAQMLVEAGLRVLGRGGITAFTIDNICAEAAASRGLITHHFGSKDGLLAAVYRAAYRPVLDSLDDAGTGAPDLGELIERSFRPDNFTRESLNIWLALWGEIAVNPQLLTEHRKLYAAYRATMEGAIRRAAQAAGRRVEADRLAVTVISLVDGLWLEQCIDPSVMTPAEAKAACLALITPVLGPLGVAGEGNGTGPNS
ncbi:MAG: TetR family transcriptional regulator C-terminal domain-containing protein [Rhodobacteraceae bacterium]|nr:TetR family transcriptional regulator C-terminal domain-containing protein [Paracoccaceae bacterium]